MRTVTIARLPLILLPLLLAPLAAARDVNSLDITAAYVGGQVQVTIDMDIDNELPADWVGWVVERSVFGECHDTVDVTGVMAFPVGPAQFSIFDEPEHPDLVQQYRAKAVDDAGGRPPLTLPQFPPVYYSFDYAMRPDTPLARGTLFDLGWTLGLDLCPGTCWEWISFLSGDLTGLEPLVGTGAVVELYGRMDCDFEGPYVVVESWALMDDCGTVDTESTSWSAFKSLWK